MKRVVIVGGGITGLALAHALDKATSPCDVTLVEASGQLGGNLSTTTHNGFTIDAGPDSWVASKPHATRLVSELGLDDELIGTKPDTRKVYIVWQRKLHAMPEGLVMGIPTETKPFIETDLLGLDAKLRAALDLVVPAKKWRDEEDDESIAAFVSRRLGPDIAERIAGPLLGGIFAGDPEALSVRASVPQLVEAEIRYGSLIRAMRALRESRRKKVAGGAPSTFLSLKRGMGDLVVNVAHRLRDAEVRTSCPAHAVTRLPDGDSRGRWAVEVTGETLYADDVALALPTYAVASLVSGFDAELASMLSEIEYASSATVFLAYKKYDVRHPLDAFGFLVPRVENSPVLAGTFVSSKWEHRAPMGHVLIRVFVGGQGNEDVVSEDDETLSRLAMGELRNLLGVERPPVFTKVFRFNRASPQPYVGHIARMKRIMDRINEHPGLHAGGNGYIGTGISDAIKQGEEIAARIAPLAPLP